MGLSLDLNRGLGCIRTWGYGGDVAPIMHGTQHHLFLPAFCIMLSISPHSSIPPYVGKANVVKCPHACTHASCVGARMSSSAAQLMLMCDALPFCAAGSQLLLVLRLGPTSLNPRDCWLQL